MKFTGINLTPEAIANRKKADALLEAVTRGDHYLAEAAKLDVPEHLIGAARKDIDRAKAEIAKIEREIITL